ncbi:MAG: efflux transporter outer membrane subunit [Neisseriaceae bacterium]|nr:efflux transporter outer membrane subunit [Neisseriaceae bacterium]MBP6862330.1 efflux transporter outer membrane subunit [Neisseriaceae bacterium]
MKPTSWSVKTSSLMLALALTGCASMGPEATSMRPLNPTALQLPAGETAPLHEAWWQNLGDAQLNQLIDQAIQQSPSLAIAQSRLSLAEAQVGASRSNLGPQVDLNASGNRQRYSENSATPMAGSTLNNYTVSINAAWAFDFWGKHRAQVAAALGTLQAAQFEVAQARLLLVQNLISQYTQWQRLNAQIAVADERINVLNDIQKLLQARVNVGIEAGTALHDNQINVHQLQLQQHTLRAAADRTRHALAALSGQSAQALNQFNPSPLNPVIPVNTQSLRADLLGKRPDIAAQRALLEAASERVRSAKAEFYPNVQLTGLAGYNAISTGDLFDSASHIFTVMPAVSLPIFHSGALRANLAGKRAEYDVAISEYNQSVLNALKEAADALSDWQHGQSEVAEAQLAWISSDKLSKAYQARTQAGLENKLTWLQKQSVSLAQQSAYIDSLATQKLAWNSLNTAFGGGFNSEHASSRNEQ